MGGFHPFLAVWVTVSTAFNEPEALLRIGFDRQSLIEPSLCDPSK
ncbi:MAG: hypothetical protein RJA81_342 [Planctomycetota bacterium]|jgi:hypothetical protein